MEYGFIMGIRIYPFIRVLENNGPGMDVAASAKRPV